MSNRIPEAMPLPVQGNGLPWPAEFDPTENYPRMIFPLSAAGTFPIARGAYVEITGTFSGWEVQPEGSGTQAIPLMQTACFPVTKDGTLVVSTAGTGTPIVIVWSPRIGREIAKGRGFAPPGGSSTSGSSSAPKATPTRFTTSGRSASVVAGANISGVVTVATAFVVIMDQDNALPVFFAETQAKAALLGAAGGGQPLYAAGSDVFPIPPGGSLWAAAADVNQLMYGRAEVAT